MIRIDGLNKYYNKNKANEIHVIDDVTLELPSLGLISFLGASGSGKTTLLNVIGGLDKASGSITYDSFEMKKYDMSKIDRFRNENFGYVFQSYNLLLNETVYNNLKIALELIDVYDEKETDSRIEYALKSVGMYKYRKKKASQLSGGQQQRVAIARALVKHCKVIIADEPTGNLDSANAIEVMNILKSISKKTLVLLVTHNESLANFYSDYIYRVEDGRVVDGRKNDSADMLDTASDNVIYLKDIPLSETESETVKVKLYSNEEKSIELEIVERNNTFYIRSNRNIKLVESSNIRLVDDHYKPTEKSESTEYNYDDSFFDNSVREKKAFRNIGAELKHALLSFFKPTKKTKVIYISLALIGILFAICAISISNAMQVDTSGICADNGYSTIYNGMRYYLAEDGEEVTAGIQKGQISSVQVVYWRYTNFAKKINFAEEKNYDASYGRLYYNDKVNNLVLGRAPSVGEIAISRGLADELLSSFGEYCDSYEDLFDLEVDRGEGKLVGIVDNPHKMIYIDLDTYIEDITSWVGVGSNTERCYECEKKHNTYEIILGRDLEDADRSTNNILISDAYYGYEELVGTDIDDGYVSGHVVGVYKLNGLRAEPEECMRYFNHTLSSDVAYKYSYLTESYTLIEGREPAADNECLVSIYSKSAVGDEIDGYKIVGRYNASMSTVAGGVLFSPSALSTDPYSSKVFVVENEEGFLETVGSDFELMSMYDREYRQMLETNAEKMTVFSILGVICLIAASIMVFFLMRSRMINDIYNIGVYRSLGSGKTKIYAKYFADTFVMVSLTSLIAYVAVMFIYLTAIDSINYSMGAELFNTSFAVPILGVIVLYAVNLIFGLLPIITLLRKTPSEILAKYDI